MKTRTKADADEICHLHEQKLHLENAGRHELRKRISKMGALLREQPATRPHNDELLVHRLIEKVTVYEDKSTMEPNSSATMDVNE